ncbi:HD domain containing protein [Penicillium taxi]|uniref:HD domain containing protein n=1 Tax=Penicillium taxi TaxID=168475 RepID=UPI0025456587|nr:HD domain containing protein [Penicillium taxi]KAJ5901867.1 HD domain containing protein [Penicillium taxi]
MAESIRTYGFTAVPASASTLLNATEAYPHPASTPEPIPVSATPIPTTKLAQRINTYALSRLSEPTYNHSLRVYHYGIAIKRFRFSSPDWDFSDETYFLACVLHDIGTTDEHIHGTKLSFEFFGGMLALQLLQSSGDLMESDSSIIAPREQAESVAEAIIRHQDLCEVGKITAVGQLLQLATIFVGFYEQNFTQIILSIDNTGSYVDLVHPDTIQDVSTQYPRLGWTQCFVTTIRKENELKPWAHTTALGEEEFPAKVLGNTLMKPYE